MLTTQELLDLAKLHSKLASDYKLGIALGLGTSAISNYRHGRSKPDDQVGADLAKLAGLDAGYVLACLHAERAKDSAARTVWESVAQRLATTAAAAALVVVIFSPDRTAQAAEPGASAAPLSILCKAICRFLRRALGLSGAGYTPARWDSALALA